MTKLNGDIIYGSYLIPSIWNAFSEVGVSLQVVLQQRNPLIPERRQMLVDVGSKVLHEGQ